MTSLIRVTYLIHSRAEDCGEEADLEMAVQLDMPSDMGYAYV